METLTLDPKQVIAVFAGVPFNDWESIEIQRNSEMFKMFPGIASCTFVKTNDKSGIIILKIKQTSLNNDVLTAIRLMDEATNQGVFPVEIKDMTGTSNFFTATARIEKAPNVAYDAKGELNNLAWRFLCPEINMIEGGNLLSGAVV